MYVDTSLIYPFFSLFLLSPASSSSSSSETEAKNPQVRRPYPCARVPGKKRERAEVQRRAKTNEPEKCVCLAACIYVCICGLRNKGKTDRIWESGGEEDCRRGNKRDVRVCNLMALLSRLSENHVDGLWYLDFLFLDFFFFGCVDRYSRPREREGVDGMKARRLYFFSRFV